MECTLDAFLSPPKRFQLMEILHVTSALGGDRSKIYKKTSNNIVTWVIPCQFDQPELARNDFMNIVKCFILFLHAWGLSKQNKLSYISVNYFIDFKWWLKINFRRKITCVLITKITKIKVFLFLSWWMNTKKN
jgi:hypothetical protein